MIIKNVNDNRRQEFVDIKDERRRSHYLDETKKQKREKRSVWQVTMQFFIRKLKMGRIFELKKIEC